MESVETIRPWRTATLVASAIATVELLVIVGAGVWFIAKPLARDARDGAVMAAVARPPAAKPALPPAPAAPGAPKRERSETSVLVLNGNGRAGAAAEEAERVGDLGYVVGGVGNAPRTDYMRTTVMYRRGYSAEAARLARDLRVRIVGPLDGLRPADLLGAQLVVVVGS
jgi:hypothetical protein